MYSVVVSLWVHIGRHCHFNKISVKSSITLFVLVNVIEETFRIIFQPNFSKSDTLGVNYGVKRTPKLGRLGYKNDTSLSFRGLNKLSCSVLSLLSEPARFRDHFAIKLSFLVQTVEELCWITFALARAGYGAYK